MGPPFHKLPQSRQADFLAHTHTHTPKINDVRRKRPRFDRCEKTMRHGRYLGMRGGGSCHTSRPRSACRTNQLFAPCFVVLCVWYSIIAVPYYEYSSIVYPVELSISLQQLLAVYARKKNRLYDAHKDLVCAGGYYTSKSYKMRLIPNQLHFSSCHLHCLEDASSVL